MLFLSGDDPEKLSSGQRRKTNHSAAQRDRVSLPVQGKAKNALVRTPFNTMGGGGGGQTWGGYKPGRHGYVPTNRSQSWLAEQFIYRSLDRHN